MKILMIFHIAPYPPRFGPSKRNLPFLLQNMKKHRVSVLSFGSSEDEKEFREKFGSQCDNVVFVNNQRPPIINFMLRVARFLTGRSSVRQLFSRTMQEGLDKLVQREKFDLIHCTTPLLAYHELPNGVPLIGDMHNVEFDNIYRAYKKTKNIFLKIYLYIDYRLLRKEEVHTSKKFDMLIAMTERDREIIKKELPHAPVVIIPHGVDDEFFTPQQVEEQPRTIVFTGLMSYYPNHHGVLYFLDEIFPLICQEVPDARVFVVGAYPGRKVRRRAGNNVIVTGWVDDVKPYMAQGQVFIVPLLIGGGMRGKALEAMAMRRVIVTTTLGCEGINLKHEESALFADSPRDFADAVIRLFNDQLLRERLAERAYQNVIEGYCWEAHGKVLEHAYHTLVLGTRMHKTNGEVPHNVLGSTMAHDTV